LAGGFAFWYFLQPTPAPAVVKPLPTVTQPAPNYTGAILAAWSGLQWAFTNAAVVIQPTAAEIKTAASVGATSYPHTEYPPQKLCGHGGHRYERLPR